MVGMLVEYMGKTGTLPKSTVKFNKRLKENKMWAKVKEWFRDVLNNIMEMQKYPGVDQELLANVAINSKRDAVNNACNEIANGMSKSFYLLAQAAVAKSDNIDVHASMSAVLTKSLAEATATITTLTKTNSRLVAELARSSGIHTRATPGLSQKMTQVTLSTHKACHVQLITLYAMENPSKKLTFVTAQDCANCGKKVFHLPVKYP